VGKVFSAFDPFVVMKEQWAAVKRPGNNAWPYYLLQETGNHSWIAPSESCYRQVAVSGGGSADIIQATIPADRHVLIDLTPPTAL